jgi:hypothetical protein
MEIRSYRRVFDLERRIYRIDRLRLNPSGVPVRGAVYFLVILVGSLVIWRLPLFASIARLLPWYVRDLALPAVSAAVLTIIRVEGRPFHLAAYALARFRAGPRRLAGVRPCAAVGQRWHPEQIVLLPDGSDSTMRRIRYTGPGAVLVAVEHECGGGATRHGARSFGLAGRSSTLTLRALSGRERQRTRGQVIALARGARLLVRSESRAKEARR